MKRFFPDSPGCYSDPVLARRDRCQEAGLTRPSTALHPLTDAQVRQKGLL